MRATLLIALACLVAVGCAPTPSLEPDKLEPGAYRLDPTHASVVFRVGHGGGLSRYTARFDTIAAELDFDPTAAQASRLTATIEAASISTGLPDFDAKLAANPSLFDAAAHPTITFTSTSIETTGPRTGRVTGDLTLRGVTRPTTLSVTFNGGAFDPLRRADAVGFSATTTIKRTDFGADAFVNFGVADEVEIAIEAEFLKRG